MARLLPRGFLAFCLLTLTAFLTASCASSSDDSATENPSTPQSQPASINTTTAVIAGWEHSCALHRGGIISCWGRNNFGQLGNGQSGEFADSSVPSEVANITDATAVTTGSEHSCALHESGTVSCWGKNYSGQLGNGQNGENADSPVPSEVANITDATAVTTGWFYSCALHQDGTVSCWGNNTYGQLGNGKSAPDVFDESADSSVPLKVLGITDATAIASKSRHSCALREGGTISCWGYKRHGQLGNAQSRDGGYGFGSSSPVEVAGITDATAIAVGQNHSCALRQGGTISCWGNNEHGQLGNRQSGENASSSVPVQVTDITDATAITTGSSHSCALHLTGTISCWGNNEFGQLGNGQGGDGLSENDVYSPLPVRVVGITDATVITAGANHSCALQQDESISCWGNNEFGQLGNGQEGDIYKSSVPLEVVGIADATAIATSGEYSCALHLTGTISCWGNNEFGQLGNGQSGEDANSSVPVQVTDITDATAITTGYEHSCALRKNGTVSCWGRNNSGQLGNGQSGEDANSSVPVQVTDITDATAITTGLWYSCALREGGSISCWGNNEFGQLGNGQSGEDANSSVPVQVTDITDATAITTGLWYSCALRKNGTVSCWGDNENDQLGSKTDNSYSPMPAQIANITNVTFISAGGWHTCALHQTGIASCWGNNEFGQLGNRTDSNSQILVEVLGITDAIAVTAGDFHSCALHEGGTISCWGLNLSGRLGNGQRGYNPSGLMLIEVRPVGVIGITDAKASDTGYAHSCALHQTGAISCWGRNNDGQLGNGVWLPQPVIGFGG